MLSIPTDANAAGASVQVPENGPLSATLSAENGSVHTPGTTDPDDHGDRLTLFELNGKAYTVPKRVGPNVALRYLRDVRRHGPEHAIAGIMEALLGREAMDALADYDDLTEEQLEQVMEAVQMHVLGPLEKRSGKR